jgi:ABC-2 type transport system permease protein
MTTVTKAATGPKPEALQKRKSKLARALNAVVTIAMRDIVGMLTNPLLLAGNLVMSVMLMGMMGGGLAQNMSGGLGFDYLSFMTVGMIVQTLFMGVTMSITSLVEERQNGFIQEIFVSPISRVSIILGKIIGSSFTSIVQLAAVLAMSLIMGAQLPLVSVLLMFAAAPLICLAAGALAVMATAFIKSPKLMNVVSMMLVMPQMFLAGVMIPIGNSTGILYALSRVMPMTYCVDFLRHIFYRGATAGITVFPLYVDLIVIAAITVVFTVLGTVIFSKAETDR